MKRRLLSRIALLWLTLALGLSGCAVNRSRTYRGGLLNDKVTTQRVQAALKRAGPDFNSIEVQTTRGTVILSGTVNSPEIRSRAEAIARSTHRVSDLQDDLQVGK